MRRPHDRMLPTHPSQPSEIPVHHFTHLLTAVTPDTVTMTTLKSGNHADQLGIRKIGKSQAVQWFGLNAFTAKGPGSISGRGN